MPVNLSQQSNEHNDFVYMPLDLCDYWILDASLKLLQVFLRVTMLDELFLC